MLHVKPLDNITCQMGKDDELNRALALIAEHGWSVRRITSKGYTQVVCACGQHANAFPKTPSNRNTWRRRAHDIIRQCSTKDGRVR